VSRAWQCCGLAALLAACQTVAPPVPAPGDSDWIERLGPWRGPRQHWVQLATFSDRHNDATHVLRFDVVLTREKVVLAGQSTLGVPLFLVTLADGRVTARRHPGAPADLPAERALADFLIAVWPLPTLSAAFSGTVYTVEADADGRRLLKHAGNLELEITGAPVSPGRSLLIRHHDIPLTIRIETLEQRAVDP
jgi:hypothetical protein